MNNLIIAKKDEHNYFNNLPIFILYEIYVYLKISEFSNISVVSKMMHEHVSANELWRPHYLLRFKEISLVLKPTAEESIKSLYKKRLDVPLIGDILQVSWTGQFVLATVGPYRGKAWWDAEVVAHDESKAPNSYHVRYDGWQNNWNEWVSRDRLRWHGSLTSEEIGVCDRVELQIDGRNCKALLECTVAEKSGDNFIIKDALVDQELIVGRNKLRPFKRQALPKLQ